MKKLSLTLLMFVFVAAFAQEKTSPNYQMIREAISNESSVYYYPKLIEKYRDGKTDMTLEEKRHLYYGFVYHKSYIPSATSKYDALIIGLLNKKSVTNDMYQKIVYYANLSLAENPFNTDALQWKTYALFKLGASDSKEYNKVLTQAGIIRDAILSSGSGKSPEEAYSVILVQHEYDLIGYFDMKASGQELQMLNDKVYDYVLLEENHDKITELYFDITPAMNPSAFKVTKKSRKN